MVDRVKNVDLGRNLRGIVRGITRIIAQIIVNDPSPLLGPTYQRRGGNVNARLIYGKAPGSIFARYYINPSGILIVCGKMVCINNNSLVLIPHMA